MEIPDYTFCLMPGIKTKWSGEYDPAVARPSYDIRISAGPDCRELITLSQVLMYQGTLWVYELKNGSTWPAFVSILKDGVLVPWLGSDDCSSESAP